MNEEGNPILNFHFDKKNNNFFDFNILCQFQKKINATSIKELYLMTGKQN